MHKKFEVLFLEEAVDFLQNLDDKTQRKVLYNIRKASMSQDAKLFKKLAGNIWEFRTLYNKKQVRLLAFWDKEDEGETLVISTHGFVKKTSKVPKQEIERAETLRTIYFDEKN